MNFASVDLREPPVLILKNANGTPLGVLGNARNVSIDIKYNETSMLEFELPERVDGIKTPFYELVNGMSLVELQGIGQFTVVDPSETDDGLVRRKTCKAYSLEYELTYKTITIPEGTYNFWNPLGTGESVLNMILERLPSWSAGDIDQKLIGKYRTFEINNENIYNVIKSTLQESYQCIIDFDTYERKINARAVLSEPATEPVFLSTQNLAKQIEVTEQSENIVTRLDVNGAEGVTIRDVNPTGTNKLIDLSHFMNTGNFPQTLIDKYNAWETVCDECRETYYQDSIAYSLAVAREVAERAALVDLQGELTSIENIQAVAIEGIAQGIAAQDDLDEANAQLAEKQAEVDAKQADVDAAAQDAAELLEEMKAITQQCSFEAQFTADELKMLDKYLIDGDISDSSFVYSTTESFVGSDLSNSMASIQAAISDATATRIAQGEGWIWDIRGGEITVGDIVEAELVSAVAEIDGEGKLTLSAYIANGTVQDTEIKKGCVSITSDASTWTDDLTAPTDTPTFFEGTELTVSATDAHFYFTYNVSELERRSVAWDLYEYGRESLDRLSQPSYTFSISSANFFSLDEFLQFRVHISLGERVYIEVDEDDVLKPICIGVRLTWEDPTSLELSFSDGYLSGDSAFRLADLLDKSASMSRKVDISKYTYASFADSGASSDIKNFMESALDIAKRGILSTGEQAITIDDTGIRLRKWANDDKTAYDDKQVWMHNNSILMTKDNWNTASIAIGAFHDENAGDCWGIVAPMIAGTILAGSSLVIESEKKGGDGNTSVFRVDENGCTLYDCDLNVLRGDTQIAINPHIGIAIGTDPVYSVEDGAYAIDEEKAKLWMDTDGNLHMKGVLDAASGNFRGNVTAESLTIVSPDGDVALDVYISGNSAVIQASNKADAAQDAADAAQSAADAAGSKADAAQSAAEAADEKADAAQSAAEEVKDLAIVSTEEQFYASNSPTLLSGGTWSPTQPVWTEGKYIWRRTLVTYGGGSTEYTPSENGVCITGNTGANGVDGTNGKDGSDGKDGTDGVGIQSITNYYLATASSSGVTADTAGWTETVQAITETKRYLWNYETIAYTNGSDTSTTPVIIGVYGEKGTDGKDGVNGTNGTNGKDGVGIESITEYYQVSTSNVQTPTSWQTSVPTLTPTNKYLWNYEEIAYTDGSESQTAKRVIGVYGDKGEDGADGKDGTNGIGISQTEVFYYLSTSNTTQTGGSWVTTPPAWVNGRYYWQKIRTTYSDSTYSESTPVCITGAKGADGTDGTDGAVGTGIDSITTEFYLSTSKTTQTGGSWVTEMPEWEMGMYLWTRTKIVYKDPASTAYTAPVCDSSWEATNEALEVAQGAQDDANAIYGSLDDINQRLEETRGLIMTEDEIKGTIFDSSEYGTVVNQVAQTANELSVTRTEIFGEDGLEERVSVIESGVHISGSNIGIWSSDSPFQMNIDNTGWEITESGQPTIVARESKMIAPRVQITDAFMIGSLALRSSGGHMKLLKYGGGN